MLNRNILIKKCIIFSIYIVDRNGTEFFLLVTEIFDFMQIYKKIFKNIILYFEPLVPKLFRRKAPFWNWMDRMGRPWDKTDEYFLDKNIEIKYFNG